MRGLSQSEVAERVANGQTNATKQTTSRPLWHIIRDNVFTLFNAILTVCFAAVVVFSALLWEFPFLPRQLTLVSTLTIGIPSFVLALAPNKRLYHPGILRRLIRYSAATGVVAAVTVGFTFAIVRSLVPLSEARTITTIALFVVAFWILCVLSRPLNSVRSLLLVAMFTLMILALTVPFGRDFFALDVVPGTPLLTGIVAGAIGAACIEVVYRYARRRALIFDRE